MVVPAWHMIFLKEALSYWLATASNENLPEPIKCTGIKFDPSTDTITCFAPLKFMSNALIHLKDNPVLALVGVELHTYEGYQYKGTYLSHRDCTPEEVSYQLDYLKEFCGILESFGYSGEGYFNAYFHPPFIAVGLRVEQVFDQSPKVGAGSEIRT